MNIFQFFIMLFILL